MPDYCELPLDQLARACLLPLPSAQPHAEAAWQELQRRAWAGNDRAWDLLVSLLWPVLVGWIYQQLPDLAPTLVAELAQRLLWHFRNRQAHGAGTLPLPTIQLTAHFQRQIREWSLVHQGQQRRCPPLVDGD